jgi:type IV pilus assembly protein PilB
MVRGPADAGLIDAQSLDDRGDSSTVALVNGLLLRAVRQGASDIHIEPYERELRVRFRVDGQLRTVLSSAPGHRDAVVSRLKVMAHLDIAEKRLPQDGRIRATFSDAGRIRPIDIRASILPTLYGEKVVLRLLDPEGLRLDLTALGFAPDELVRFDRAIHRPWGMVLVTGPTGSGKTSTLYSSLARLNHAAINIVTAEDPVELHLPGVNQVQVREQIGLTFASVLRSLLRQDPNIILVGEIRDGETAATAVKAALTGHLVLSTLHTNDAPTSITRLVNMGVEPFLVASALHLVCAQRLVRRICIGCRDADETSLPDRPERERDHQRAGATRFRGRGCDRCGGTGYHGRVGVFEVMEVTDGLRDLVVSNASAGDLRRQAIGEGMIPLRQGGLTAVEAGLTTMDEVVRETM